MSKKNFILLGIFIFLAFTAFLIKGPIKNWQSDKEDNNFFANIIFEKINKIEVIGNDSKIILEKDEAEWKIAETKSFYIDPYLKSELNNLLQNLDGAKFDLVSENTEKKSDFMGKSGIQVKIYEDDYLINEFLVGKIGTDYPSTYISELDSDIVYMVNQDFYSVFSASDWYDKTIISLNTDLVNKIRVQHGDRQYTLELDEKKWIGVLPSEFVVDQEKVNSLLEIVYDLSAVKIPEQKFEGTGLEKNNLILQFIGDGVDKTIMIGDKNEEGENYFAKRADSDNLYLISEEQKNSLDLKITDIKK